MAPSDDDTTEPSSDDSDVSSDSLLRAFAAAPDIPVPEDVALQVALGPGAVVDGNFRIEERLGAGGMGVVYAARDLRLDREVALKFMRLDRVLGDPGPRLPALFEREAKATARINHPNVVTLFHIGEWHGLVYLVLERLRGETLQTRLERGPLPLIDALEIVEKVAQALVHTHAAGIVHRDLKPSNVFLMASGVKVLDFGVSGLSVTSPSEQPASGGDAARPATASHAGTPGFMAPEQWRGEPQDARTDLWAVGVMLHLVATGRMPFGARSLRDPVPALDWPEAETTVPAPLRDLIASCLMERPGDRLADANELERRIREIRPQLTREGKRAAPRLRRWPWLAGAVAVIAIAWITVIAPGASTGVAVPAEAPPAAARPAEAQAPPRRIADLAHARSLTRLGGDDCAGTPAFADARTVVFDLTRGEAVDLYRVPIAGGEPAPIAAGSAWEWHANQGRRPGEVIHLISSLAHPERSAIAYLDLSTGVETMAASLVANDVAVTRDAIYYVDRDGSAIRRIRGGVDEVVTTMPPAGGSVVQLDVSPTGDLLAYAGRGDDGAPAVCVVPPGGAPARCTRALPGGPRPAFATDGSGLYYASRDGIIRRDLASGLESIVVAGVDARGGVAVAPDGAHLVYSDCGVVGRLFEVTASPPRRILDETNARQPAFGPADAMAWTEIDHEADVLQVRLPDGRHARLTTPAHGAARSLVFSADGRNVFFVNEGGQGPGIYAVDALAAAAPVQLTDDAGDEDPAPLRDGRIAFTRRGPDGLRRLHVADGHGGPATELLSEPRDIVGVEPRTGELLLRHGRLTWFDPVTRRERPGPPGVDLRAAYVSLSPSARWIAFQTGLSAREVWRVPLDGSAAPQHVYTAPTTLHRAAIDDDGRIVVAVEGWSGNLYTVPAAAGARF